MKRHWRWLVVALATALLASLPSVVRLLPVADSTISATTLLDRIRSSSAIPYSGYAQSEGGLDLPVSTGSLSAIGDLLGGTNQLRVWWRSPDDWRVDTLALTGESDIHQTSTGVWSWNYESDTARHAPAATTSAVRLPRNDDLLPGNLARRVLSETPMSTVTRLPSTRIAGRAAAGLRVTLIDSRSTVERIDVWALPGDGLPVRVSVFAAGSSPVVTTELLDLDTGRPAASTVAFQPVAGGRVQDGPADDLVAAIDRFGRSRPPDEVAGLARRSDLDLGAVGVYGRGVAELVALPLSRELARQLVPAITATPEAVSDSDGVGVATGAVNLQLSAPSRSGARWLVAGTVTAATLRAALADLPPPRAFGPRGRR
jgi:hypothetical protein